MVRWWSWNLRRPRTCVHLIFILLIIFISLCIITRQTRPKLIVRDLGYLTRPIWDTPIEYPKKIIPHFQSDKLPYSKLCALHGWTERKKNESVKVIDAVIFSVELDILEVRIKELWDVVDIFVIMEASTSFIGIEKRLLLKENMDRFKFAREKLVNVSCELDEHRDPTQSFHNEGLMRSEISQKIKSLKLKDGDLVIVGDVDEIPSRNTIKLLKHCKGYPEELHLQLSNYIYSFEFPLGTTNWKPHITIYDSGFSYHHSKRGGEYQLADSGWHCSFCFKFIEDFVFKMTSYSHNDRVTDQRLLEKENIQRKICNGSDIFEMFPEAYTYKEFIQLMGDTKKKLGTDGLPQAVVDEYEKFKYLLPGGCIREEAPKGYKSGSI